MRRVLEVLDALMGLGGGFFLALEEGGIWGNCGYLAVVWGRWGMNMGDLMKKTGWR